MRPSLPARGVWIEIAHHCDIYRGVDSHSPQGECGLKCKLTEVDDPARDGHSPQGECGLKFDRPLVPLGDELVTPRKGSVD